MDQDRTSAAGAPASGAEAPEVDITQVASHIGARARVAVALPAGAQRSLYNLGRIRVRRAPAIAGIARGMSPEAGRAVRAAALQTIRAVAEAQIQELEQQR